MLRFLYLPLMLFLREELFYQLGLRQFGDFSKLNLEPAPSLRVLVRLAVECEDGIEENGLKMDEVTDVSALSFSYIGSSTFHVLVDRQASYGPPRNVGGVLFSSHR